MKVAEKIAGFFGGVTKVLGKYNSRKLFVAVPVIYKLIEAQQYVAAAIALAGYVVSQGFADGLEKLVKMFPEIREIIVSLIQEFKERRGLQIRTSSSIGAVRREEEGIVQVKSEG